MFFLTLFFFHIYSCSAVKSSLRRTKRCSLISQEQLIKPPPFFAMALIAGAGTSQSLTNSKRRGCNRVGVDLLPNLHESEHVRNDAFENTEPSLQHGSFLRCLFDSRASFSFFLNGDCNLFVVVVIPELSLSAIRVLVYT